MEAVIVTHNSAADRRAQVASRDTVESFDRVLVVDDASTDDTRDVAATCASASGPPGSGFATTRPFACVMTTGPRVERAFAPPRDQASHSQRAALLPAQAGGAPAQAPAPSRLERSATLNPFAPSPC